ncbi:MAG: hypothetical protein J5733_05365 [Bacteroidaceae bacterium]|nr:hypothetical protein [Bacteroidaceae bacterium]
MKPLIALNGIDIRGLGLVPLAGSIAALVTPPKYKKLQSNDSSFIHGTRVLSSPSSRRYEKNEISLSFFVLAPSQIDLKRKVDSLIDIFVKGKNAGTELQPNYKGVNELYLAEYDICLRLVYSNISKFSPWFPHGNAIATFKFTEPNPNNRTVPETL